MRAEVSYKFTSAAQFASTGDAKLEALEGWRNEVSGFRASWDYSRWAWDEQEKASGTVIYLMGWPAPGPGRPLWTGWVVEVTA